MSGVVGRTVPATFHDPLTPGTLVLAWAGSRKGSPLVTRTRSEVWALGDGTRVVKVEGHAGGIALTHVDVLPNLTADADARVAAAEAERDEWANTARWVYEHHGLEFRRAEAAEERLAAVLAGIEALANDLTNPHAEVDDDFQTDPLGCIADALRALASTDRGEKDS